MADPYLNPDEHSGEVLEAMAVRLEERGRFGEFARMIGAYLAELPRDRALKVLDIGCGTGVVTRQLVAILHPDSEIHGADVSAGLLIEAERLAPEGRIVWDHIKPGRLPYEDGKFDVVTMHTLLSHVADPLLVLEEVYRVLRRDGRLIVFDADHASTTYSQPDYEMTRRVDHLLTSAIATNHDICRQLPRLLKEARFQLLSHDSEIISECGVGDFWLSSVRGFERLIPTLGVLSAEEAEVWVRNMIESHESGTFFASGAFYTFHAQPKG